MREAIQQILEMCPRSLTNLRANVVLLTGKIDDSFLFDPTEGLISLERLFVRLYERGADRVITYSLDHGLRTYKEPSSVPANVSERKSEETGDLDIDSVIREARQEHAGGAGRHQKSE